MAGPKGALDGAHQSYTIAANDQIAAAEAYRTLVIAYRNSAPVLLRDVAEVIDGLENAKVVGWYKGKPAVDHRHPAPARRQRHRDGPAHPGRAAAPAARILPVGAKLTVVHDRTDTIRASIRDVQFTLVLASAWWCWWC